MTTESLASDTQALVSDGIPPWQDFMIPVLKVLSDGKPRKRRELIIEVQDVLGILDEQRSVLLNSGQSKVENRVGWAISDLTTAGAIYRPVRGISEITDLGRTLLAKYLGGLNRSDLETIDVYRNHQPRRRPETAPRAANALEAAEDILSPLEQIEAGMNLLHAEVSSTLIERLRASDPAFFEQAVVDLLLKMGYGGAEQRGRRIGGTGDGGVDGVIDQDALGLDQVYVQAKRYGKGNNVGREAIQSFVGALHGIGATRGVFITTSTFTSGAREYANAVQSRVILIDESRLTALMIKYRVGVQVKQCYEVVELDEDFFE
ncbi:restriction endonuclease [Paenarthrobacter sp. PH39-S1]|uniref:restriction endonuclease n=1 Tax=Paenarthrobacter sp. PH39-S1 TaxID=3046204 RepID=UPI0024BB47C3|nr:restriction endonuclease [Paenarthrobacter sp. PH39-S1]MDJ0355060.1 restriction endonuclease [Paenarthrobacter sp. PH39-S1]